MGVPRTLVSRGVFAWMLCGLLGCAGKYEAPPSPGSPGGTGTVGGGGGGTGGTGSPDAGGVPGPLSVRFDALNVFLAGTLQEGTAGLGVVAQVDAPTTTYPGLPSSVAGIQVRPDGKVLYLDATGTKNVLRIFVPYSFGFDRGSGRYLYPSGAAATDPVVATPGCDATASGPIRFQLDPDDGAAVYACATGAAFLEDGGVRADGGTVLAVGNGHAVFLQDTVGNFSIVDIAGAATRVSGLPTAALVAARASSGGFWAVPQKGSLLELWQVSFTGSATRAVTYGTPPFGYNLSSEALLDGAGNLWVHAVGSSAGTPVDAVLELPVQGGPGSVVYSEAGVPPNDFTRAPPYFAFWSSSRLFSGP